MYPSPKMESPKPMSAWKNFRTGETDWMSETPTDFSDYVPQGPGVSMYRLLVDHMGKTPIEACMEVLSAAVGEKVKP